MAGKPSFAPGPIEAIRDKSLTAQDWRILMAVAFHDRLSLPKGSGAGCTASNLLLAEETQMAYAAVCRTLTRLVQKGYLAREKPGRVTVYRVVYSDTKSLRGCPIPAGEIGDDTVTNQPAETGQFEAETYDYAVTTASGIGDDDPSLSCSDQTGMSEQYIPLRGVIDSAKQGKEIPYKGRDVSSRGLAGWQEAFDRLPNDGAKVSSLERAWQANPEWFENDLQRWTEWLAAVEETYLDENNSIAFQANRLFYELSP